MEISRIQKTKSVRRRSKISIALTFLVVSLVGCTSASQDKDAAQSESAPVVEAPIIGGTVNILTWQTGASVDAAVKTVAKLYEKTHPGTTINVTILPYEQYEQKLQLAITGGKTPDIFQAASTALRLVESGKVLRLDDRIANDPLLSDDSKVRTTAYDLAKFDGTHVDAFPTGTLCGMQLFYNQDLFDKAGVTYPTAAWTWDDFLAAAQKLTVAKNGKTTQWGTTLGYLRGWDGGWQAIAASNGMGSFLDSSGATPRLAVEQPQVESAWQLLQDLIYKYKVAPTLSTEEIFKQSGNSFQSGKTAMVVDGCWQMGPYDNAIKNLGMMTLPVGSSGQSVGPVWGSNMIISKDSKNIDTAWDFLRWWTVTQDAMVPFAKTSAACGSAIVKEFDALLNTPWVNIPGGDACANSLNNVKNFSIYTPNWGEVYGKVIDPTWNTKLLEGKITAKEFVATLKTETDGKL
ncbi:hypothetical protein LBMAG10_13050 [Actinomycetes bacterium]|nr:hypothetical protein LBMAG10_13050 [Actinomycetes bacterium]